MSVVTVRRRSRVENGSTPASSASRRFDDGGRVRLQEGVLCIYREKSTAFSGGWRLAISWNSRKCRVVACGAYFLALLSHWDTVPG